LACFVRCHFARHRPPALLERGGEREEIESVFT
jgi:hypothetical protein